MNHHDANENAAHLSGGNAPYDPAKWSEWMNMGGHGNFIGMRYRDHGDIWIEPFVRLRRWPNRRSTA